MSRGQLARTPENFPRMKYRAAGRHAKRQANALQRATSALEEMSLAVKRFAEGIAKMAESLAGAFRTPPSQSDFALIPADHPALADPEGLALVKAIHDRKTKGTS